jgi:AcrR family transcriptional regulator
MGLADKRRAILRGALTVFARDGYTRASVDSIASEAGVSTRTIYNHFQDKAELFQVLIRENAVEVADFQIGLIERYLRKITDLEEDLIEFGNAFAAPIPDYADHFALVRQINAEAGHIPQAALDGWQEAGPRRVRRALADKMRQLVAGGLLRVDDPDRAATHFALLTSTSVANPSQQGAIVLTDREIADIVRAGVRIFLYGYSSATSANGVATGDAARTAG